MTQSKSIIINTLDEGFIINIDGKKSACEGAETVRAYLAQILREMTKRFISPQCSPMRITIEVEENIPQLA